jgi:hypothetical protein
MPIDYSEYPDNWHEVSRRIRFERAENKCEWCGAENGKPHPVTGSKVVLTVAHLNHEKHDLSGSNLAALCQKCHLGHDLERHIFNRKYGRLTRKLNYDLFEGTEWALNNKKSQNQPPTGPDQNG